MSVVCVHGLMKPKYLIQVQCCMKHSWVHHVYMLSEQSDSDVLEKHVALGDDSKESCRPHPDVSQKLVLRRPEETTYGSVGHSMCCIRVYQIRCFQLRSM